MGIFKKPAIMYNIMPFTAEETELFHRNYQKMMKEMSGENFSRTESEMKECFGYMARIPHGARILSKIKNPPQIKSSSENDMDGYVGLYQPEFKRLRINVATIKQLGRFETVKAMQHELLHALQHERGMLMPKGVSPQESVFLGKLCEAETAAWDDVLKVGWDHLDKHGTDINGSVDDFVKKDLRKSGFQETDPAYLLQQALIKTKTKDKNGKVIYNREWAEKIVVGNLIQKRMSLNNVRNVNPEDKKWQEGYDGQAVNNTKTRAEQGNITAKGNPQVVNNVLQYMYADYNIPPECFKEKNGKVRMDLSFSGEAQYNTMEWEVEDLLKGQGGLTQNTPSKAAVEQDVATQNASSPINGGGLNSRLAKIGTRVNTENDSSLPIRDGNSYC